MWIYSLENKKNKQSIPDKYNTYFSSHSPVRRENKKARNGYRREYKSKGYCKVKNIQRSKKNVEVGGSAAILDRKLENQKKN